MIRPSAQHSAQLSGFGRRSRPAATDSQDRRAYGRCLIGRRRRRGWCRWLRRGEGIPYEVYPNILIRECSLCKRCQVVLVEERVPLASTVYGYFRDGVRPADFVSGSADKVQLPCTLLRGALFPSHAASAAASASGGAVSLWVACIQLRASPSPVAAPICRAPWLTSREGGLTACKKMGFRRRGFGLDGVLRAGH